MTRFLCAGVIVLLFTHSVYGQQAKYVPLSSWQSDFSRWRSTVASAETASAKLSSQPSLPGLRPVGVELLEDALLRKHPTLLRNNIEMARRTIERRFLSGTNGRNQLNGAMAEALFLRKNPAWHYVGKPNAPQHDVYRWIVGQRTPLNGQVKFHQSGKPGTYAADMTKDFRAHRFFVPDDHVQPLREYWLARYSSAQRRGDASAAKAAARNAGRVQPLGVTSAEIGFATKDAYRFASAESRSVYMSLAAGVALSVGQVGWDYAHGTISADQAAYRTTKALTLIGTGVAANASLRFVGQGALRGTLRGNLIVAGIVLVADTSWNVYEHGGRAAFRNPDFYEQLGGSVSAVAVSGVAGFYAGAATTALASELGPAAPVVGGVVGVVVGAVTGAVAYAGGRSATSWLVQSVWPELYQEYERQNIAIAKAELVRLINIDTAL